MKLIKHSLKKTFLSLIQTFIFSNVYVFQWGYLLLIKFIKITREIHSNFMSSTQYSRLTSTSMLEKSDHILCFVL